MLDGIRKAANNWLGRAVLILIMGVLILSFAIWGIGDMLRVQGNTAVATVGGVEISSEQVRAQLAASRALVLPSFAEGLPVVVMEAMAQGRPVLTTTIAGIPELVRPGLDGWLFAPGDAEAAAQAMAECLATPVGTLQQMGRQARERVTARHHIDREAEKLHRLFEQAGRAGGTDVG